MAAIAKITSGTPQQPTSSIISCIGHPTATKALSILVLSNLVLSYLSPGKDSANAAETCRAWRYLARKSLESKMSFLDIPCTSSEEMFHPSTEIRKETIQTQRIARLKALDRFPNLTILNLKDLRALYRSAIFTPRFRVVYA